MSARIRAIRYALPKTVVDNEEWATQYPQWDVAKLAERTGVYRRHVAEPDVTALDLAERATLNLVADRMIDLAEIDAVIFCTQTPDYPMPPNSCVLHGRLRLPRDVLAFDITLACSGFVYGLELARSLMGGGRTKTVLLVTGDTYTRLIHPGDRATRCLFGDGAAATVIEVAPDGEGILDIACGTNGSLYERFMVRAGGMRQPHSEETSQPQIDRNGNVRTLEHIVMDGMGVLSFFNSLVPVEVRRLLDRNKIALADVDLFVFHQASRLALDSMSSSLGIPSDKIAYALEDVGNLVSASIPVALQRAIEHGRARPGQLLLLCGFGVGLSWGTALVRL